MSDTPRLGELILDLIIDGREEPFALTYGEMRAELGREPGVEAVFAEVAELERKGFVIALLEGSPVTTASARASIERAYAAWLPNEHDHAVLGANEVGLWLQITDAGIAEWRRTLPPDYDEWQVTEVEGEPNVVTTFAADLASAEKGIAFWRTWNQVWIEQPGTRTVEPLPKYLLRSGRIIRDGVKVAFRRVPRDAP